MRLLGRGGFVWVFLGTKRVANQPVGDLKMQSKHRKTRPVSHAARLFLSNFEGNFSLSNFFRKMKSNQLFPALLVVALSAPLHAQNYFTVKFPDDRTVIGCGLPSTLNDYPEITGNYLCLYGVGVSVKDQIFFTNGTTCGKILRRYRLLYWCDYDPNWTTPWYVPNPEWTTVGPTVFATPQNHGYLEYTQIIKFLDDEKPRFLDCPAKQPVFCDYTTNDPAQYNNHHGTDLCEGAVDLRTRITDICSKTNLMLSYRLWLDLDGNGTAETFRTSSDSLAWPIELSKTADTLNARIKFPLGFGLPYGQHMVEWIAMDNCGNQSVCKYPFIVKDCAPPTLFCVNGLSVNIMQTGMITLWATDFLLKTFDNCTPQSQIKIRIRKKGTGSGFPQNSASVTFDCTELGTQIVEIWASDGYGNATYCETFIDVQDPFGDCLRGPGSDDRASAETRFCPATPNPANGFALVNFELAEGGEVVWALTNLAGQTVATERQFFEKGRGALRVNLPNTSGQYILRLRANDAASTQRIQVF